VWEYKGLLDITGIEPVTTLVVDVATVDSSCAINLGSKLQRGQSRTICICDRRHVFRPLPVGLYRVQGNARAQLNYARTVSFYIFPKYVIFSLRKNKGKTIPLQALTDPEGSRRLKLPDFKTIGT